MKNLVNIMVLFFSLCVSEKVYSQYSTGSYDYKIDLKLEKYVTPSRSSYNNNNGSIGVGMMSGGALFVTAGLLTVPDYEMTDNGEIKTKPFFRQGARMLSIVTGSALFVTGIVVTIGR